MPSEPDQPKKLGTFGGVFTPSILTILGLVLFLRLGYVVGNAGIGASLLILALATAISLQTSVSLAAIATNRKVRAGGDYYLISRSLGVAYGGGLGLILFVAQAVSVGFYCVGFGEAVGSLWPELWWVSKGAALLAALLLMLLAYVGADLATRFQLAIMSILIAALVSFFAGGSMRWQPVLFQGNLGPDPGWAGFWPMFAIFFPAVTGFTQGVSMSGDLESPARSLPMGTFLAVGVSTIVYLGAILVLGGCLPSATLVADTAAMKTVSYYAWLVDAGVWAATLSSALASFLGAPRILQALASDGIFSGLNVFAKTAGPSQNPRRAVLLTGAIAFPTIGLGNLNAIAALVSMFFLLSYGLLNYATYVEARAASPSFRPRFRWYHWSASLIGTLLCIAVMLAINPLTGLLATAILVALHQYVRRTAVPANWRDSRRAYEFRKVKEGLHRLSREPESLLDWQPHILAFTGGAERRERLLSFASWIAGGSGVITAVSVLEEETVSSETLRRRDEAEKKLRSDIEEGGLDAFPLVVAAHDIRAAAPTLVQAWGVGPVRANTVLLNWTESLGDWRSGSAALWYARLLSTAIRLHQNVIVLAADDEAWSRIADVKEDERRIDVWWWDDESSHLALLLAYLMTRTETWNEATLRVLIPTSPERAPSAEKNLRFRLEESRIRARISAVVEPDADRVAQISADATVVYLPLRISGMQITDPFGAPVGNLLQQLPTVALVAAAHDIELAEVEPVERATDAAVPGEERTAGVGGDKRVG